MKKIAGYAAVFNSESYSVGNFVEMIAKKAFEKSIKRDDIRALFNHDPNFPLGRLKARTLTLSEDDKGLRYKVEPPDTQWRGISSSVSSAATCLKTHLALRSSRKDGNGDRAE